MTRAGHPIGVPLNVDCHVHLFDPARHPYRRDGRYQPAPHETATREQLLAVMETHGVSHAVIVTPTSGYGPDNAAAEAAIAAHPDRLRGIAVVEPDVEEGELARLKSVGFAGVRFDLIDRGAGFLAGPGARLAALLREMGMILDLQLEAESLSDEVLAAIAGLGGRVLIDHMGRPDPATGSGGFWRLLALAEHPNVVVKLSGPFRFSRGDFPHLDADPIAAGILDAFGLERCVWGSDWPFVLAPRRIDYGPCLAALERWVPDLVGRRQILWETPKRLFGFGDP